MRQVYPIELWQTEWCPASRRIRERLTELGIDYVIRQVPVDREQRELLRERTGAETIPALVVAGGPVVVGEDAIRTYLERRFEEPPEAEAHKLKAAKARRRYLEEECSCLQPATH